MKPIDDINANQEKLLLSYVFLGSRDILSVAFPPEDLQLAAIRENKNYIKCIYQPTKAALEEAYGNDTKKISKVLKKIDRIRRENQDLNESPESFQIATVSEEGCYIKFIENPSESVQLAAIKNDYSAINYIKSPTEKVQKMAINYSINALQSLRFVLPIEKTNELLAKKISSPNISTRYVKNFLSANFLTGDKLEFINRYGSTKAKKIGMEHALSGHTFF